ncbi:MAG: hypothetical protein Q4A61_00875 [Porphyromonadaceae bacterium]|nr:hypothetical protein [Porphyromonadaceae bacterium]
MKAIHYLRLGFLGLFAPLFGVGMPPLPGKDWAQENLDRYTKETDIERLRGDWRAIGGDLRRALDQIKQSHGQADTH